MLNPVLLKMHLYVECFDDNDEPRYNYQDDYDSNEPVNNRPLIEYQGMYDMWYTVSLSWIYLSLTDRVDEATSTSASARP